LDAAEALALALAKNSRGLHGVLAAEQAQLAPVTVASGAARAVRGGTDLQAALVLCFTTRTSKISLEERQSNRYIFENLTNAQALLLGRATNARRHISVQGREAAASRREQDQVVGVNISHG
jgi:hypothetical protein